jgi:tetratricopeptide (TPR) repeat protein
MAERFKVFKQPEQQRAILNLMIQSLNFDRDNQCSTWLAQIGLDPAMNQRFGKEMITAITPIAQSNSNITIHQLLLDLMQKQKQYTAITEIGPKLLPSNGAELDLVQFLTAETMPLTIAKAHERLGNLDQAMKFYELLGEYHRQIYGMSLTERNISYITSWHLGRLAWKQGKADQAIALLRPVTTHKLADWGATMDDGSEVSYRALAYNLLGEIFQSQGKKAEAKQQFEASAKADKGFQTPKDNLAKLK